MESGSEKIFKPNQASLPATPGKPWLWSRVSEKLPLQTALASNMSSQDPPRDKNLVVKPHDQWDSYYHIPELENGVNTFP